MASLFQFIPKKACKRGDFGIFPMEIMEDILHCLNVQDLAHMEITSSYFMNIIKDGKLWMKMATSLGVMAIMVIEDSIDELQKEKQQFKFMIEKGIIRQYQRMTDLENILNKSCDGKKKAEEICEFQSKWTHTHSDGVSKFIGEIPDVTKLETYLEEDVINIKILEKSGFYGNYSFELSLISGDKVVPARLLVYHTTSSMMVHSGGEVGGMIAGQVLERCLRKMVLG